jgi:hypothetical protein
VSGLTHRTKNYRTSIEEEDADAIGRMYPWRKEAAK